MDVTDRIELVLKDEASTMLRGATEDMRVFLRTIAEDTAVAATITDQDERIRLLGEIRNRLPVLRERHRIKAVRRGWEAFEKTLSIMLRVI